MLYTFDDNSIGSFFCLSTHFAQERAALEEHPNLIYILWNRSSQDVTLLLDEIPLQLKEGQLISCTYLQRISIKKSSGELTAFGFNREFYCIQTHDDEVSCNGILFFGAQQTPLISLDEVSNRSFDLLYQVFLDEFKTRDNIQGEMLIMLLKRLIIKTTRLAKEQNMISKVEPSQVETIRKFNLLVDQHYRNIKQVSEYADLLHKSPKTLSNLFAKAQQPSPMQIIHQRIVLEAKRLLLYTDKPFKEIAYELGYKEVASLHKLFKRHTLMTPQDFRNSQKKGKMNI
jgi:AraC-like DNA-binding protein